MAVLTSPEIEREIKVEQKGQANKMKEVTVKVPDDTLFIHVMIGIKKEDVLFVQSKTNTDKTNLNIVFGGDEQNE